MILTEEIEEVPVIAYVGDILFFSNTNAFLITCDNKLYYATQIIKSEVRRLGYIDYSDPNVDKLVATLISDHSKNPIKIINMSEVKISF